MSDTKSVAGSGSVVGSVYAHISNGGVRFSVENRTYGACLVISSSHFGTNEVTREVYVTNEVLKALADMFKTASEVEYNDVYCHAAQLSPLSNRTRAAGYTKEVES